jgi:predicted transcriptional regulator
MEISEMVMNNVNKDIDTTASLQSYESLMTSPRRIKMDAIASILEIGDRYSNNDNNEKDNAPNTENGVTSFQAKLKELSIDFTEIEVYLSLLSRKGFIEYDQKDNNTYKTTQKGSHILQLYQKVLMWLH